MGRYRCRYRPSCYWEIDNLERAFEPGSGEPGVTDDAGWPCSGRMHGTIQSTNNHQRAGYRPERNSTPVPGSGTRRPGTWPLSLCCQGSRTLDVSASALSVSAIALSISEHGGELDPPPIALRRWRGGACWFARSHRQVHRGRAAAVRPRGRC